mmetsp:Transcript_37407/g.79821  ORF Transcript_37407/g.79821 Transcript_37407/m.79821 type:complete len:242 (-) Transcript_37407:227-952(-)
MTLICPKESTLIGDEMKVTDTHFEPTLQIDPILRNVPDVLPVHPLVELEEKFPPHAGGRVVRQEREQEDRVKRRGAEQPRGDAFDPAARDGRRQGEQPSDGGEGNSGGERILQRRRSRRGPRSPRHFREGQRERDRLRPLHRPVAPPDHVHGIRARLRVLLVPVQDLLAGGPEFHEFVILAVPAVPRQDSLLPVRRAGQRGVEELSDLHRHALGGRAVDVGRLSHVVGPSSSSSRTGVLSL